MSHADKYSIDGIDLTEDSYLVEQSLIRSKYAAYDDDGNKVLGTKQKMFKAKEEFPFTDPDGNEVFTVKAGSIMDVAGNYMMTDASGNEIVVLDNDFSIMQDTWRVRDPDSDDLLAEINSQGAIFKVIRTVVPYGQFLPHKYEITDADDNHVGNIDGQFSLKDKYDITIDDASNVPKEAIIAAAMVIDAIQGN
jgi:uncharacterized protein YxjI